MGGLTVASLAPTMSFADRAPGADHWRRWVLVYAAVTAGVLSSEIAVNVSIEGAATPAERSLVLWAALLTGATLPAGIAGYVAERRSADPAHGARVRGRLAIAMGAFALVIGLARSTAHARHLFEHVGADADEPLTTLTITLQLLIALASTSALVAFAGYERVRAGAASRSAG